MGTLTDEVWNDGEEGCHNMYRECDLKEAINKVLKDLIIENPDTINTYTNKRILESFKNNFGDALLGQDDGGSK